MWRSILRRCNDIHSVNYGAKGIGVRFKTFHHFQKFYMSGSSCAICKCEFTKAGKTGKRGTSKTVERLDPTEDYSPVNCILLCLSCNVKRKEEEPINVMALMAIFSAIRSRK